MVVEESKRGMGIGSELMQRLVERLTEIGIQQILLRCREDTVPFYELYGGGSRRAAWCVSVRERRGQPTCTPEEL